MNGTQNQLAWNRGWHRRPYFGSSFFIRTLVATQHRQGTCQNQRFSFKHQRQLTRLQRHHGAIDMGHNHGLRSLADRKRHNHANLRGIPPKTLRQAPLRIRIQNTSSAGSGFHSFSVRPNFCGAKSSRPQYAPNGFSQPPSTPIVNIKRDHQRSRFCDFPMGVLVRSSHRRTLRSRQNLPPKNLPATPKTNKFTFTFRNAAIPSICSARSVWNAIRSSRIIRQLSLRSAPLAEIIELLMKNATTY